MKERLLDESDPDDEYICVNCGEIAIFDHRRGIKYCPICGETEELHDNRKIPSVRIPYAFKLLLDELKSMCVYPKLKIKDKVD